ncbi:succinate dehydrogenase [Marivirga tractuosa]|uniref:Succinate dehydrogenase subunit C n=1 Tax=Marivirga tractuosa (strain ATCC 23168 / DSM 4126 / NBRC 15989 / NCIMB 1408 / VKM B-1430 / H-43) TaxID=643867 RepID=E4TW05_MARTH|nr:succinate dehydrogenase cytochrome b subunit [Marivirga tractuosa]ADR23223.1 succinate dehydrogenase subunit C [Marivirga tractuosa DSM 4126]BDD16103.1 succinate dehydrogenase [Marivirga tractuosa]
MSWLSDTLTSTIGRKLVMSLTGLFLIIFLVVHLAGNFQLLAGDGGVAFNEYAKFMTSNPLIKFTSYGLYAFILIHIVMSIALAQKNKKARPVGYDKVKGSANSSFSSRNMGILGFIIFVFLVIHMRSFWYEMHWGSIPMDSAGNKDLYKVVSAAFSQWWYVAIYVVCMVGLAFHLSHGFSSAFQTLGVNHKKYTPFIKKLGIVYAILIPAAFASIPLIMFFNS